MWANRPAEAQTACMKAHYLLTSSVISVRAAHASSFPNLWSMRSTAWWVNGTGAASPPKLPKRSLLRRLQQINALEGVAGAWKDKDHPELKSGADHWVKALRKDSERRLHKTPTVEKCRDDDRCSRHRPRAHSPDRQRRRLPNERTDAPSPSRRVDDLTFVAPARALWHPDVTGLLTAIPPHRGQAVLVFEWRRPAAAVERRWRALALRVD